MAEEMQAEEEEIHSLDFGSDRGTGESDKTIRSLQIELEEERRMRMKSEEEMSLAREEMMIRIASLERQLESDSKIDVTNSD
ncbi:hypothetical protein Ciccas_009052 [Cichlidogyrus casuarinus]|uniref:Uncharacterized protein n=1 Tax=Cichlidogyrus casuarinus TaxID=1844966 RepID=A0ABD2Q0X4_9PLAT